MIKSLLIVVALLSLESGRAFAPQPKGGRLIHRLASVLEDSKLEPIDFDMERAKQCAENFGACSVEEMEMLRDRLHKEHLQAFVMGHPETTAQPEEAFEHRLVEEELSLQLSLLKEQMPESAEHTLFPPTSEAEDAVEETLGTTAVASNTAATAVVAGSHSSPTDDLIVKEGKAMMMFDEETMETVMICLVIGALSIGLLNV